MIRRPPRSTLDRSSAASDVYKRQVPDDQLDLSDIPEITDWSNAVRQNQFYRPVKQQTSIRLDADVLAWFKAQGKGYQTRMNEILRDAMLKELKNHQ
nr:BrnA antitoxin family protein [Klebsiella pneumoniae]